MFMTCKSPVKARTTGWVKAVSTGGAFLKLFEPKDLPFTLYDLLGNGPKVRKPE